MLTVGRRVGGQGSVHAENLQEEERPTAELGLRSAGEGTVSFALDRVVVQERHEGDAYAVLRPGLHVRDDVLPLEGQQQAELEHSR